MKRWLLALLIAATAAGDTSMQIRNGILQTDLDANTFGVINLKLPIDPNDAATKAYVDSHAGGSTGPGTSLTSLVLGVPPNLFLSPVTFDVSTSDVTGTMTLAGQNANTIFGNPAGNATAPIFMSQVQSRTVLQISNVDNTSDLNKPISGPQTAAMNAALAAFTGSTNLVTLGTVATGVWNGSPITANYLPTLSNINPPTGNLNLASFKITALADPSNATDATNKQYVDSVASAGPPHVSVAVATTANVALTGEQTINGVTTSASRILVKNQTTGTQNGIYVTAAGAWSRAADANTGATVSGNVFVTGGTVDSLTQWGVTTPQPITLGTTSISYTLTGASAAYTAGNGLTLTGNQFSAVGTTNRISIGTGIDISTSYAGQSSITTLGVIGAGTWQGTVISGTYGGTGVANAGRTLTLSSNATLGGTNTGDITLGGENYLSLSGQALMANPIDLSTSNVTGTLGSGRFPALTGPVVTTAGSTATSIVAAAVGTTQLANQAVTFGKIQNFNPSKLIGNPNTFINPPVEISLGTGLSFSSGVLTSTVAGMPSGTGMVKANSGVGAIGTPSVDYAKDAEVTWGLVGTTTTPVVWPDGVTAARSTASLNADYYTLMPHANAYAPGTRITYTDGLSAANFGRVFRPQGLDHLLWGGVGDFRPFISGNTGPFNSKSTEFITDGASDWRVISTASTAFRVEDSVNAIKYFTFDASLQATTGTLGGVVTAAPGQSYTFKSTSDVPVPLPGVLVDANNNGTFSKRELAKTEVVPNELVIGLPGVDLSSNLGTVTNGILKYDTIRIAGNLQGNSTLVWPPAGDYQSGETLTLLDASGSVSPKQTATIVLATGDTFTGPSGGNTYIFDEPNGRKVFTSDGANRWTISTTKTSIQGFASIPNDGTGTFTISGDTSAVKHNGYIQLQAGANQLKINNPYDGMTLELVLVQPQTGSGNHGTLTLPSVSYVGGSGVGLITLTTTDPAVGAIDKIRGSFVGAVNNGVGGFLWDQPILAFSSSAKPSAPTIGTAVAIGANAIDVPFTDTGSVAETSFEIYRSSPTTGNFQKIATLAGVAGSGNSVTYHDTNCPTPLTVFYYRVLACNAGGCSSPSGNTNATTLSGAPAADLWAVNFNAGTGTFAASAVGPAPTPGMNLAKSLWATTGLDPSSPASNTAAFAPVTGMAQTAAVGVAPSPAPGASSTYNYRVNAWKSAGPTHNAGNGLTGTNGITATGYATLSGINLNRLTWTAVTGADYYTVSRTSVPAGSGLTTGALSNGTTVNFTPTALSCAGGGTCTLDDTGLNAPNAVVSGLATSTDISDATGNASLTYGNLVTVSFWVKSAFGNNVSSNLVLLNNLGGNGGNRISATLGNKLLVNMNGSVGNIQATASITGISDGNWHLVVVVLDNSTAGNTPSVLGTPTPTASDNIRVYFDGATQQTLTYAANPTRTGPQTFAAQAPIVWANEVTGVIDDFRIYSSATRPASGSSGALTTTEITALYTAHAQ